MADGSRIFDARESRDPTALADVYRAHARYVWRVLRHCGVPDSDLDDAVQETFLVVFRRLPDFEARASLRTWIYAVAVRVAATRRRSQRREAARREHAGHDMHGTRTADPEAELSKAEAADLVDRLLDELDAPKRTVFVLAELEGVKVPEISRILGVNPHTVQSRLRLARASFGSALERMKAREANDRRVARLRPRPLLEKAANDRPPTSRRKAAMAALAVRIEQGAMPTLAGWEALALGSGWLGAWGLPAAVIGAVGVIAAVAVGSGVPTAGTRSSSSGMGRSAPASAATTSNESSEAPASSAALSVVPSGTPATSAAQSVVTFGTPASSAAPSVVTFGTPASSAAPSVVTFGTPASSAAPSVVPSGTPATSKPSPTDPLPATASPTLSSLAAETLLLEEARSALRRGELDTAFAALDRYAAEFPQGLLLDEARSTRLRTLCAAGRSEAATALADRWAPGQPGSRWHDVVAAACR